MKKTGNISIKTAKALFGAKLDGSIDIHAAEKAKEDSGFRKTAGQGDVEPLRTSFFSPRLTQDTWMLPRSRKMVLKWIKIYADWDPTICSILRMHARYPISEFNVVTENEQQRELFEAVFHQDQWDILDTLRETAMSWMRYGESVILSEWSDRYKIWSGSTLLDPALIEVEEVPFTSKVRIYAEIPRKYEKLWKSRDKELQEDRDRMPQEIVDVLTAGGTFIELDAEEEGLGQNYDPARCVMLKNKADVGEDGLRGQPMLLSLLRELMYGDFLHKAQFERAKRFAYPVEFWKLGDISKDIYPTEQDLSNVRQLLRNAMAEPPFSIIYSPLLSLQVIGAEGQLLNIKEDIDYVLDQKLIGLGTNKNIVLGEGSWLGASKTISMQRLIMDYEVDREMYTRKVIKGHYMRGLCMAHGYTVKSPITGLVMPVIPNVNWARELDPQAQDDKKKDYADKFAKKLISAHTYFTLYPELSYEKELILIEKEKNTYVEKIGDEYEIKIKDPKKPIVDETQTPPTKPEKPVRPEKPTEGGEEKGKDEKTIKVVEPELHEPPKRPEPKTKVVKPVVEEK